MYLYCSGLQHPCAEEKMIVTERPRSIERIQNLFKNVLKDKVFGIVRVCVKEPDEIYERFSEMPLLFARNT